jgi:hypothetical protein
MYLCHLSQWPLGHNKAASKQLYIVEFIKFAPTDVHSAGPAHRVHRRLLESRVRGPDRRLQVTTTAAKINFRGKSDEAFFRISLGFIFLSSCVYGTKFDWAQN